MFYGGVGEGVDRGDLSVVNGGAFSSQRLKQILIGKQWEICGRTGSLSHGANEGLAGEQGAHEAKTERKNRLQMKEA